MGIRSMLRKVFGRDREDSPATSVPPQSREETVETTEPAEPVAQETPEAPVAPEEEARRAADDLVAASFDNPQVPKARKAEPEPESEPVVVVEEAAPALSAAAEAAKRDAAVASAPVEVSLPEERTDETGPTTETEAVEISYPEDRTAPETCEVPTAPEPGTAEKAPAEETPATEAPVAEDAPETEAQAAPEAEAQAAPEAEAQAAPEAEAQAAPEAEATAEAAPEERAAADADEPQADVPVAVEKTPVAETPADEAPAEPVTVEAPAPAVEAESAPETEAAPAPEAPAGGDAPAEPVTVEATATAPEAETATVPEAEPAPKAETAPAPGATAPEAQAEAAPAEKAPAADDALEAPAGSAPAEPEAPAAAPEPEATAPVITALEPEAPAAPEDVAPAAAGPVLSLAKVKAVAPHLADAYKAAGAALKKQGLAGARAAVYLVVDRSGSMRGYFKDGSVQRLAEQTVALAAHLDENAAVTAVFFSTDIDGTAELTPATLSSTGIEEINAGLGRLGRTHYHRAVEEVLAHHEKTDPTRPALVVFQTDGAPDAKTAATQALAGAADRPLHWRFVAWGEEDNKAFDYLRKLGTPRTAAYFPGATPAETAHAAFYRGLLEGLEL
ncbi:VWA domain-containing protein [Streptomyces cinereoruber]|uniref:VWA domain-containing protein n=1 Tax=Streptomyces cinereoruber TaxID=67260 RepID=UPI003C2FABC6